MVDYQIRNGIVLEEILGRYLLISTEAAREKCHYIRLIDDITAYYWQMMEQGLTVDEMVECAHKQFGEVTEKQLKEDITELIQVLKELGYLLKDDELEEINSCN